MSNKKLKSFEAKAEQAMRDSVLVPCEISYLLYKADVLNTGCQQNAGMENEYDQLAQWVHQSLAAGASLQQAIFTALTDLFDEDTAKKKIREILGVLQGDAAMELKSSRQQRIDALHLKLFPECYDHRYDSIEDARIRRRGQDPMSAEYQAAWQQKRRERGISETLMSPETEAYAVKFYAGSDWVKMIK
jgi:outer membrane translocation and assembly module TamA